MKESKTKPLAGMDLVNCIIKSLKEKLAEKIVTLDLGKQSGTADYFIVCQGDNTTHISAIGDGVLNSCEENQTFAYHVEGLEEGRWVLLDYSDVVVHIMLPEVRGYYTIEELWANFSTKDSTNKQP